MPPTYHQLKLQLWWILSDPDESHDRYLEEYRAFFRKQAPLLDIDATFSFGEVCRKQTRNHYEEPIYQVDCTIEWPGVTWFGPSNKHLQVGRAWCNAGRDEGSNKALFQWLVPSPLEAFQLATHPVDRNVSLLSFSFGTLAELGTYMQHQQFSAFLYRGHRNYWVDATFQHDQRSLHIDLHLNHHSGCEDRVAEYRFVMPYLNILKVLINEQNSFVELYLHLKIPPMLMGEVVSDIPARPGSAAAASPLCWERYLAIGCNCISGAVRTASLCGGLFLKLVVRDHSLARRVVGRLSQRCAHGTLICYTPIRTYSSNDAAFKWSHEVQVHFENRILRKFNSEFTIRVSFRDDNLDKLSFTLNLHSSRDALLDAVVGSFLRRGVPVGTREFKFLAPSTTQLRDPGHGGRRAVCAC